MKIIVLISWGGGPLTRIEELENSVNSINNNIESLNTNVDSIKQLTDKINSGYYTCVYLGDVGGKDIYTEMDREFFCYAVVYNELSNFTTQNWIGNVDGIVIRIGMLMIASSGWSSSNLYVNINWGGWRGWVQL